MQLELGNLLGMRGDLRLQGMTQAQLVKLLFVLFLSGQPRGNVILRLQRDVEAGGDGQPFLSKCLLLLRKRLCFAFIPLKLLGYRLKLAA